MDYWNNSYFYYNDINFISSNNKEHGTSHTPPNLARRISSKYLYTEERLREQIRQAETREKLVRKQANEQRIGNEKLMR